MEGGSRNARDVEDLLASVKELHGELQEVQKNAEEYCRLVREAERAQQLASDKYAKQKGRLASVQRKLGALQKKVAKGGSAGDAESAAVLEQLDECAGLTQQGAATLAEVDAIRPVTGSNFVRFFLGRVNVRVATKADRRKLRDEYDKFKDRTNWGFMIAAFFWMLSCYNIAFGLRYVHWVFIITHIWMIYYFVSLALRENILKVNGSSIRPWWIRHHYISAFMNVVMLTWPESTSHKAMVFYFTAYFLWQALVQFGQAWYQKSRHYARVAMGTASPMDVKTSDGISEFHSGIFFLIPILISTHAIQMFMGWKLASLVGSEVDLSLPWWQWREEVQVVTVAICLAILSIGNFITLVDTIAAKIRKSQRKKAARAAAAAAEPAADADAAEVASPGMRRRGGKD